MLSLICVFLYSTYNKCWLAIKFSMRIHTTGSPEYSDRKKKIKWSTAKISFSKELAPKLFENQRLITLEI